MRRVLSRLILAVAASGCAVDEADLARAYGADPSSAPHSTHPDARPQPSLDGGSPGTPDGPTLWDVGTGRDGFEAAFDGQVPTRPRDAFEMTDAHAGPRDSAPPAPVDASASDRGPFTPPADAAATLDAMPRDAAVPDASPALDDATPPDAGAPDAGPVVPAGMVLIRPGVFTMGLQLDDVVRADVQPREVTISRAFFIGRTEVTQRQWRDLMGNNPSSFAGCGPNCPVERINWFEAAAYCNALSARDGLTACYELDDCNGRVPGGDFQCATVVSLSDRCSGYRLPSEAEWEYAARGQGADVTYPWGNEPANCERALFESPGEGGYACREGATTDVCSRSPAGDTPQGLCDMAGSVWEWVEDYYGPYAEAPVDGSPRTVPGATGHRIDRGGGLGNRSRGLACANRNAGSATIRDASLGFRVARTVDP